uniref:Uncharacterized protein TCIL3000_1_1910 n=1 Tax=Trypanosoma congolense (strain IL3000) TaxID=1068625 RepID=G0UJ73_TRYCI|nr:unnamed protein product [Trypanosoma congolense IL3000]
MIAEEQPVLVSGGRIYAYLQVLLFFFSAEIDTNFLVVKDFLRDIFVWLWSKSGGCSVICRWFLHTCTYTHCTCFSHISLGTVTYFTVTCRMLNKLLQHFLFLLPLVLSLSIALVGVITPTTHTGILIFCGSKSPHHFDRDPPLPALTPTPTVLRR